MGKTTLSASQTRLLDGLFPSDAKITVHTVPPADLAANPPTWLSQVESGYTPTQHGEFRITPGTRAQGGGSVIYKLLGELKVTGRIKGDGEN